MVLKQSNLFHCTCWYQGLSFNFTQATLFSAVSMVMLWPCTDRLNSLNNLLKISARYANCCNQETPEKQMANDVSFINKTIKFLHSVELLLSEPYKTTNEIQHEKSKFHTHYPCHCKTVYIVWNLKAVPYQS
jgi:hypothetical protein